MRQPRKLADIFLLYYYDDRAHENLFFAYADAIRPSGYVTQNVYNIAIFHSHDEAVAYQREHRLHAKFQPIALTEFDQKFQAYFAEHRNW